MYNDIIIKKKKIHCHCTAIHIFLNQMQFLSMRLISLTEKKIETEEQTPQLTHV